MKKTTTLILLIFIFAAFTNAQDVITKPAHAVVKSLKQVPTKNKKASVKRCGTADADAYRMANDPDYRAGRLAFEQKVQTWMAQHPNYDAKGSVITIPVVVHVIYNTSTAAEKLTITQVNEQLTYTNADYAGTNPHSMYLFPSSLKANCGIQFCLAKVDPSGNSTTGIDYKQTTVTSFNITGSSASCSGYPERCSSTGGADAWDVTKYLNIWTCNASSQLCGISEFPTSPNNVYYGTTIHYQFFGHTGASAPYNLGGTLTHELGHCFNLYHTWGDDGGPCTGTDNCNDTPNSGNMNYGNIEAGSLAEQSTGVSHINTSTKVETDNCTTTSPGVLFQDFMDYTDDIDYACFTPDQVLRIQATLAGADSLLAKSTVPTNCNFIIVPDVSFTASATNVSVGTTVTFTDQSTNAPTSWSWTIIDGSVANTGFNYSNNTSATSQNPQITFITPGVYSVVLTATNLAGSNSCTKISYINVFNITPGVCDTLMPPSFAGQCADSLTLYSVASIDSGFVTGENVYKFSELAELYKTYNINNISDVYVMYVQKIGTSGNTYINIYSEVGGKPGILLGTSDTIIKNAIDTSNYGLNYKNKYHFLKPVVTTGNFFVSVVIPTTFNYSSDELTILGENATCSALDSNAFLNDGSSWYDFNSAIGLNIDMAIFPVVSCSQVQGCSAQFSMYADTTTLHHYYIVNMASGAKPLTYLWNWGDGTSDNTPYPSHTYSAAGEYTICLTIADSVGCTSTYCDSSNIQKSGNNVISLTVIPQSSTGINEFSNNEIVMLYPNPATGDITIVSPSRANISILNIEGQLMKSFTANSNKTNVDISSLARGIYFVKVQDEKGSVMKKFVKE